MFLAASTLFLSNRVQASGLTPGLADSPQSPLELAGAMAAGYLSHSPLFFCP